MAWIIAPKAENEKERVTCCLTHVHNSFSSFNQSGEWGSQKATSLGEENGRVSVKSIINRFWQLDSLGYYLEDCASPLHASPSARCRENTPGNQGFVAGPSRWLFPVNFTEAAPWSQALSYKGCRDNSLPSLIAVCQTHLLPLGRGLWWQAHPAMNISAVMGFFQQAIQEKKIKLKKK